MNPGRPSSRRAGFRALRWNRDAVRRVATAAGIAFLIGYLLTALLFFRGAKRAEIVTVPDVRTLPVSRARRELARVDLRLQVTDSLPNGRVPAGAVLAQTPIPGREVGPDTRVSVILSSGTERRAVPRVTMYGQAHAARVLGASGFRVTVQRIPDLRREGQVVGTVPAAGSAVGMPAVVRLLVSAGPPAVVVPSVVGLLEDQAQRVLQGTGLRIGEVQRHFRPDLAPGLVIGHSPSAGDSTVAGREVTLQVATPERPDPVEPEPVEELVPPPVATPSEPETG